MILSCCRIISVAVDERNARVRHRHPHRCFLIQRRHEFRTDGGRQDISRSRKGSRQRSRVRTRWRRRNEESVHKSHAESRMTGLSSSAMQPASNQKCAQDGNQRDGDNGRAHHRESLCECQRMKQLSFHSGQCKHRNKCQDDDGHGEEDRPADESRGIQRDLADFRAIFRRAPRL